MPKPGPTVLEIYEKCAKKLKLSYWDNETFDLNGLNNTLLKLTEWNIDYIFANAGLVISELQGKK